MATWIDRDEATPGFRAIGLAYLISREEWDKVEQVLGDVAEREGIDAMDRLDGQALALLQEIGKP